MLLIDLMTDAVLSSVLRSPLVRRAYGIWRLRAAIDAWENGQGDVCVLHRLPGRLRLRLAKLQGNDALGRLLQTELANLLGVESVTANSVTGSLLILFDPDLSETVITQKVAELLSPQDEADAWQLPADLNAFQATVIGTGPGWARLHSPVLAYLGEHRARVCELIEAQSGVLTMSVHVPTATSLLTFSPDQLTLDEVTQAAPHWLLAAVQRAQLRATHRAPQDQERNRSSQEKLVDVILAGLTLAATSFKRRHGYRTPAGLARLLTAPAFTTLMLARPIFRNGLTELSRHRVNADTLTSVAITASILAGKDLSALVILLLADVGEMFTAYTAERTREAITNILSVGEPYVWKVDPNGAESRVRLETVVPGDHIVVHIGEKISVDGVVVSGEASVDQASITGEFMPMHKTAQDPVFAGTVVTRGRLEVRADAVGDSTAVARIIHMVEDASQRKAPIQNFADKFSQQLVPLSFVMAGLVYLITRDLNRALNLLIIDYSCGVRLSTATAFSSSVYNSARQGILIKGGNYLELLANIDTLVLDKTGTVTEGRPQVTEVVPFRSNGAAPPSEREVLTWAATAEQHAPHPLADAVMSYVRARNWKVPELTTEEIVVAHGVQATSEGQEILVGSERFLAEHNVSLHAIREQAMRMSGDGQNVLYVAVDGELVGLIGVRDPLREDMKKALNRLRRLSIDDVILLTGDVETSAELIASQLTVDRFRANVLPEDKAEMIRTLQGKGVQVAMVGEGVNDAPALACADVGIVMGSRGTDLAIETADITIAGDDPLKIPSLLQISRQTMHIVRQNFGVVVGLNTLAIIMGAVGYFTPMTSAVIHNLTTVGVVLNSTRLLVYQSGGS